MPICDFKLKDWLFNQGEQKVNRSARAVQDVSSLAGAHVSVSLFVALLMCTRFGGDEGGSGWDGGLGVGGGGGELARNGESTC